MDFTGPQKFILENADFGSRFYFKRNDVSRLEKKLKRLQNELAEAQGGADIRDFESDKDRSGGAQYIVQAINKTEGKLAAARIALKDLGDNWSAALGENNL
jgi:hypothetical protein